MKITASYIIALFVGLLVGWLAQQVWLSQPSIDSHQSSLQSISRQQQRLLNLQQQASSEQSPLIAPSEIKPLSREFISAVKQENLDLAIDLFSSLDTQSIENAMLLGNLAYEKGEYIRLFSILYDLRYGLDFTSEKQLLSEISNMVEKVDQKLAEAGDYHQLVDIYSMLTSLEAENTLFYLRLSYWQLQAGKPVEAAQSLIGARNDIELEAEVKKLQAAINVFEQYGAQVSIPLRVVGEHYLVPITLNDQKTVELMLDTGASKTVVKRSLIESSLPLLMTNVSEALMNTANGQALGYVTNVSKVSIGDFKLSALDIVLMDLPNFKYDGLLGMNVLSQFDFNIDQENAQLKLLPKKPSRQTFP